MRLQTLLDLLQDRRRDVLHRGDAVGDLRLAHLRELREDAGGLIGIQLRKNEGDRLRVFVRDEGSYLFRRNVLQLIKT